MVHLPAASRSRATVFVPAWLVLATAACGGTPAPVAAPTPAPEEETAPEPVTPPPEPVAEPEAGRVELSTAFLVGGEMPADDRVRVTDEMVSAVKAGTPLFRRCYAKALARDPSIKGEVDIEVIIKTDGTIGALRPGKGDLTDTALIECTLRAFEQLSLPKPPADFTMIAPMQFKPE